VSAWRFAPIQHVADAAIPPDWMFVIAASGVAAKKTGAAKDAYNRLSFLVRTLLDLWNATEPRQPSLHAVLSSSPRAVERLTALVSGRSDTEPAALDLENRLSHFRNEDARIPEAVRAFRSAERDCISTLSDDSQSEAERLLQNQVPETIALARSARTLGAFGASSFGAGFGGSDLALRSNPKLQAPNPNAPQPPNPKTIPKLRRVRLGLLAWTWAWALGVGSALGFGIWSLGFEDDLARGMNELRLCTCSLTAPAPISSVSGLGKRDR
jgi:hypothetical protein